MMKHNEQYQQKERKITRKVMLSTSFLLYSLLTLFSLTF